MNQSYPPLPPRPTHTKSQSSGSSHLHIPYGLLAPDLRSVSQVSLCPNYETVPSQKRELLLIYIHGFLGNETSFQSFPAHLHNVLSSQIDPAYFVHTKVYPKFKTRHPISVATAQFSQWLSQFEGPMTDVVLLGHSMGGILAAEVALLMNPDGRTRRHRIMGMIAFDTPFLGMHPGVISAGLGSLFKPAPEVKRLPPEEEQKLAEEVFGPVPKRNFTVTRPKKEQKWDSTLRFITKYHDHLTQATGNYLMSHLEFGSCLADPIGLKNRYRAIRTLEQGIWEDNAQGLERVRFINYYTVSFGREKKQKESVEPAPPPPERVHKDVVMEQADGHLDIPGTATDGHSSMLGSRRGSSTADTPGLSDLESIDGRGESGHSSFSLQNMRAELSQTSLSLVQSETMGPQDHSSSPLPPTPSQPEPEEPSGETQPEPSSEHDVKLAKRAAKEAEKRQKAYEKEVNKTRERLEKLKKKAAKKAAKKGATKSQVNANPDPSPSPSPNDSADITPPSVLSQTITSSSLSPLFRADEPGLLTPPTPPTPPSVSSSLNHDVSPSPSPSPSPVEPLPKKRRERKFCITPSAPDPLWEKVEMRGVDEVGAHCGLFFIGDVYAGLVGEVARRICGWVEEEMVQREVEREWRRCNGWE
ncbi:hypothetical protein EX30DRAFT_363024 [Ascodesmis nigricans]|uniref:AB hydrolase-1 domain-containing protein n=1 Tax=Ascodesmis nigricans TaxID=341454 RepID=A0A4S2N0I6_9PEZI|nr:hypothetical protein EX30DRAFT_363024 [Ascodesmis nigricans]